MTTQSSTETNPTIESQRGDIVQGRITFPNPDPRPYKNYWFVEIDMSDFVIDVKNDLQTYVPLPTERNITLFNKFFNVIKNNTKLKYYDEVQTGLDIINTTGIFLKYFTEMTPEEVAEWEATHITPDQIEGEPEFKPAVIIPMYPEKPTTAPDPDGTIPYSNNNDEK